MLGTVQPVASNLTAAAGQVTVCTGTTLLNAVFFVTRFTAGLGNTGSTPTQGTALPKNRMQ